MKRFLAMALVLCMMLSLLPVTASAAETVASGTCGTNLTWVLTDDGTLTISGTGAMKNYDSGYDTPFDPYRDQIKRVELPEGITVIGKYAFHGGYPNLESVTIPLSVTHVRDCAFGVGYDNVSLNYPGTMEQWKSIYVGEYNYDRHYGAACSDGTILCMGACGDNAEYVVLGDGTLKITGTGPMKFYQYLRQSSNWSNDERIRKVEIAEGITSIAGYAFKDCVNLESISIPVSLTQISYDAFYNCTSLKDVYYAGDQAGWDSVNISETNNAPLFAATVHCAILPPAILASGTCGDNLTWVLTDDGTLTISGTGAMYDYEYMEAPWCGYLENILQVVVQDGATRIGNNAFRDAVNIAGVSLSDTITEIGSWAFMSVEKLTAITLPQNLASLEQEAFMNCVSLEAIELPGTLTFIDGPFSGCTSLTRAVIHADPDAPSLMMGSAPFRFCTSLEAIEVDAEHFCLKSIDGVLYNYSGEEMILMQYPGGKQDAVFQIPQGTYEIFQLAMEDVDALEELIIPDGVRTIGDYALQGCDNLHTIRFGGDAPEFMEDVFCGVTATVYYPAENDTWTADVMQDYGGNITWVGYTPDCTDHTYEAVITAPTCTERGYTTYTCTNCGDSYADNYTDPVDHDYEDFRCKWCGAEAPNAQKCGDEAYWTYENGTLTICGEGAMYDYCWDYLADENRPWADLLDQIHSVVVKDGITHIGEAAFFWMPNLTAVSLPDSVLTIGRDALAFNPSLEEIDLPGNLREIHQTALQRTALKELTLPASLMFLDDICEGCTELKKVTILGDPDLPSFIISNSVFRMCTALEEIQVEGEHFALSSVDNALYAANTLNDYALNNPAKELVIRDGTERINQFAMQQAQNVEHIIIPASVNFVGLFAFAECPSLNTVTFLGSAPEIQEEVFWNDTLTAWYPANDPTWTEDVMQDYGGTITWMPYTPPCDHTYEGVVTEPTCTEGGYTTYTCAECGDSYVDDYTDPLGHDYVEGVCTRCGGADPMFVKWYSGTTSLNGTIDLNIYVLLGEELVNASDTYVRFTYAGSTVDVPMSKAIHSPLDKAPNRYRFSTPVYAKLLTENVNVRFMKGDEMIGEELNYSVVTYCKNRISKSTDPAEVALCKALLNYGAAAQQLFNYNTENLANASLSEADKVLANVDASAYQHSVTGSEAGIKARSATLMLEDVVKVRVYFTLTGDKPIEDYTFTIDGKVVTPSSNDKGYYVETDGIAAKDLEKMFTVKVGGITVEYGALSYVNSKAGGSNELEANISKALFAYWQAAEALLG